MQSLDLELLRTLMAVAEQGSYGGAGDKVFRTQAAVSQQMRKLEDTVGVPIFEKEGRNKRLTRQGEVLLEYAKHLMAINDEAIRALREGDLEGGLRIGSPVDISDTILPLVLSSIARWSPRLRIGVHVSRSPVLMEALKRGELDLTLSTRKDPSLEGVIVRSSPTVWICSADYVHNRGQPMRLILADEPSIFRRIALQALEESEVAWQQSYEASSLVGIKAAVNAGLGVTARSVELLGPGMRVLGEEEGLPPLPNVQYFLWTRRDVINPVTRQVFEMIKSSLGLNALNPEPGGREIP